ncbi:MAG: hypothetical protein ACE5DS_00905 [Kiloniellaceae bacterium]
MKRANPIDPKVLDVADVGHAPARRRVLRLALGASIAGLATACSVPVPGQGPPPRLFRLTPKSTYSEDLPTVD